MRGLFLAAAVALSAGVGSAGAEDGAQLFRGDCALSIAGRPTLCIGLGYFYDETAKRTRFLTPLADGGFVAFEGGKDMQPTTEQYVLVLDTVTTGRHAVRGEELPPSSFDAKGRCELVISVDGEQIKSMSCTGSTDAGDFILTFSGRMI